MIYIVPDTNFLKLPHNERADYTKFYLNQPFEKLMELRELNHYEEKMEIALPELVIRELHQHKWESYKKVYEQVQVLFNSLGDYGKAEIYLNLDAYSDVLSGQIDNFISNRSLGIIPICENIWFESIVDRAINKKAPFQGSEKKSDKGFKDTIIWYSILSYAKQNKGEYIFVSNDNIFHDNLSQFKNEFLEETGSQIYICKDLNDILKHITVKAPKRYIDSVSINDEIREVVLRHTDKKYSIKLKYNQPKVFAEEDVLTFINRDIKEIYDDAYSWWDGVDFADLEENEHDYEGELDFNITYNGEGILAFLFQGYTYIGGVHGSPEQIGRVYELSTGNKLGLCELMGKDEEDILKLFSKKLKADMEKRGKDVYWDNFEPGYKNVDRINFYLDEKGIHVFFDVYEAACYAEGFVEFILADISEVVMIKNPSK